MIPSISSERIPSLSVVLKVFRFFSKKEVKDLNMPVMGSRPSAVMTSGNLSDCMILNLCLFTAHHVLYKVMEGSAGRG